MIKSPWNMALIAWERNKKADVARAVAVKPTSGRAVGGCLTSMPGTPCGVPGMDHFFFFSGVFVLAAV